MTNEVRTVSELSREDFEQSVEDWLNKGFEIENTTIIANELGEPTFYAVLSKTE